nr:DNAse I-like superfamily protein [Ipomoea batatas]
MFRILRNKLRRLFHGLRRSFRRRSKNAAVIKTFRKSDSNPSLLTPPHNAPAAIRPALRVATFNAALFSMAPAVPRSGKSASFDFGDEDCTHTHTHLRSNSMDSRPKGILKQSSLRLNSLSRRENDLFGAKSKLRVSINLPDNEISLKKSGQLRFVESEKESWRGSNRSRGKVKNGSNGNGEIYGNRRTILEVLREVEADVVALQGVKAEEEKGMKPLSDLAAGLGMNYVFAESWAPEYGNAILSKWPIKSWKAQKIFDDSDFRNVLKAKIEVPEVGEFDLYCTHLDHLDENWRMKQMNAIIQSADTPHLLAGGLNSLDETDYSPERWAEIVKYYEEMGKPTPKVEVMKYLKTKQYADAKDFGGECESVVVIAKGQSVQGTCKYGTRVDYILASPHSSFKFVQGSYSVLSSKGTSDHHIVKVDVVKVDDEEESQQCVDSSNKLQAKKKVVKITDPNSSKGLWKIHT